MAAPDSWGNGNWGQLRWGQNNSVTIGVTGLTATSSIGSVNISGQLNAGWGRKTWGNLAWGDKFTAAVTGQQVTSSLGSVTPRISVVARPTTISITSSIGLVDIQATAVGVHVNANPVNLSVGSPVVTNFETFSVTGVQTNLSVGTVGIVGSRIVELQGQQITSGFGSTFKAFTDIKIRPTGFAISTGLGTTVITPSIKAIVTGQQIASSIGNIVTKQTAVVKPTGVQIDSSVGSPFVTAWAPLDTGSSVTYSDLNTGSNVTWTQAA